VEELSRENTFKEKYTHTQRERERDDSTFYNTLVENQIDSYIKLVMNRLLTDSTYRNNDDG